MCVFVHCVLLYCVLFFCALCIVLCFIVFVLYCVIVCTVCIVCCCIALCLCIYVFVYLCIVCIVCLLCVLCIAYCIVYCVLYCVLCVLCIVCFVYCVCVFCSQLDHPNVVKFIGAVTEPSNLCILTEFCTHGSLAELLLNHAVPISFEQKLKFCQDAARGMLYLHSWNPVILHRDLKSDNLLVSVDWTVKVADFGLTRFLSEKKTMTQVGTPMWMAPEIIMGKLYTEKGLY